MWQYLYADELYHYGVKGMKWGVRKTPVKRETRKSRSDITVKSANGIFIKTTSVHAAERANQRGVKSKDIINTLTNPLHIKDVVTDNLGRRSQRFIGTIATVNVNPDSGLITTVWKTGEATRKKYSKERT